MVFFRILANIKANEHFHALSSCDFAAPLITFSTNFWRRNPPFGFVSKRRIN